MSINSYDQNFTIDQPIMSISDRVFFLIFCGLDNVFSS